MLSINNVSKQIKRLGLENTNFPGFFRCLRNKKILRTIQIKRCSIFEVELSLSLRKYKNIS